ncbi:MAG: chain-length determining protein [Muribaculaceae bacterium]|nr:chain-length determining protein [Muribaculaceae bacterium]
MADRYEQEPEETNPEEIGKGDKEIDLVELAKKLWSRRMLILKWCGVGAILGLVIAFSIPREYTTGVKLAPEMGNDSKGSSGSLGALAAMAGIGGGGQSSDAVYPLLYPDIIKSVPFCMSLLDIPLTDKDGERKFTLEEYLQNDIKSPWWSAIMGAPRKLIGLLTPKSEDQQAKGKDPFRLTQDEQNMVDYLGKHVTCNVDQKTYVVNISVEMQDPVVSAVLADSVAHRLKEYIIDYRTNKSRDDLAYIEKLNEEAKLAYYAAQQRYANYLDTHQGIVMYSAQTMRDRLENEATLAFNVYNQTSQKLQMAKAKVQEETPVYAAIEPATVPLKPSGPRKVLILAGFIFLSFVGGCAWVLFVQPLKKQFKRENDKENRDEV